MRDIQEPSNMYDPYTYYSDSYSPYAYEEELDEDIEDLDPEDLIDLDDLFEYMYNTK